VLLRNGLPRQQLCHHADIHSHLLQMLDDPLLLLLAQL
jgi:hypothetical protein